MTRWSKRTRPSGSLNRLSAGAVFAIGVPFENPRSYFLLIPARQPFITWGVSNAALKRRLMLEVLGRDIWGYQSTFCYGLLRFPHRMTGMRAAGGGLLVHSPRKPDAPTRVVLRSFGRVGL